MTFETFVQAGWNWALIALLLGMRHGLDADHLATIDGLTRYNLPARPRVARWAGTLFSLGHGMVVIVVAVGVSRLAQSAWQTPEWLEWFGSWVSIAFLIGLGVLNLHGVWRAQRHEHVVPLGLRGRLLGGAFRRLTSVRQPAWMIAIGALFAISFDTVSQAALFAASASSVGGWVGALVCALLFTAGMMTIDGLNGAWVSRLVRSSDSRSRIASRLMGATIGALSLATGLLGVARQWDTSAQWPALRALEGRELWIAAFVIGAVALSFTAARSRRFADKLDA